MTIALWVVLGMLGIWCFDVVLQLSKISHHLQEIHILLKLAHLDDK